MRFLMTTDTVGGVWTFTSELTRQLLHQGHSLHLVSFGGQPSLAQTALTDGFTSQYPDLFAYTASTIPLEWMQNNEQVHAQGEQLLQEVLATSPFDLILSNQFCFGRLATAVPRVVVAHSDVLSWAAACDPSALEPTPWLNRYTALVQTGLLDAAAITAPTAWMSKALKSNFFLPQNCFVIPNGLTPPTPGGPAPERRLQAITAGRLWDRAKGLDTLRDLDPPLPLLVAGEDTFASSDQPPWPAHITALGPLSSSDLHQAFRASAIYLCPSRYEPFGLAPLEAALCGCAIVANDLPSLREVWGEAALYYTGDVSLRLLLNRLVHEPLLLADAQTKSLERARLYTADRMASSYLHLFQTLLRHRPPITHVT